ncbi:phage tail sheath subtilisin-like domain-containing protein, partial [Marine Group I thaumarchaeote]|nr:phage tail sheath subtilisin-like domain-containing protein [Marine Group I thaumarchaeote]
GFEEHFSNADVVDVSLLICGQLTATQAASIVDIAEERKDCIAFISCQEADQAHSTLDKADCITYRNAINRSSSYAVLDSGWKYLYDRYNDSYHYIPLNGDIAGCTVQTDLERDPWWSPAGFNRGRIRNVVKLPFNPSKTERDELYSAQINPVVTFEGEGTILFGDKTMLTRPSAFDRINVRRLFIVLEKSIATAAKYSLFEFNDFFTRQQFISMVTPFLREVQGRRGIQDFKVICDETNNTPQVIDSNNFVADIFIKPNRVINYIQLNFIATPTGMNFDEIGG